MFLDVGMARRIVPAIGDPNAKIAIIGEAPGVDEDRLLEPFVGRAGSVLNQCLHAAGLTRGDVYMTNVVKERPAKNSISAYYTTKGELTKLGMEAAEALAIELKGVKAEILVPLGNVAMKALTGHSGILKYRGSVLPARADLYPEPRKVIPAIHPSASLRGNYLYRYMIINDLQKAIRHTKPDYKQIEVTYKVEMGFEEACRILKFYNGNNTVVAVDIEVVNHEVSCISFCSDVGYSVSIPFYREWTIEEEMYLWVLVAKIMENPKITKIFQNGIFDMSFLLQRNNIRTCGRVEDTMIAQHIMYPDFPKGLDFITSLYTDLPYYKDEGKNWRNPSNWIEFRTYNAKDGVATFQSWLTLERDIGANEYKKIYDFTMRLLEPLMYMMSRGILVDIEELANTKKSVVKRIGEKQAELDSLVGRPLNVRSSKQCAEYFYIEKGIKPFTKSTVRGGRRVSSITTDDKAMQRLATGSSTRKPLREARLVQDIRGLSKLNGTYLEVELDADNRLRCSYNPRGTSTGRLSSSKNIFGNGTNFQNLPQEFKGFLVADPGCVLIELDKRQAEWVVVAFLAGDANMMKVVREGLDPHTYTGQLISGLPQDLIVKEHKIISHSSDPTEIERLRRTEFTEFEGAQMKAADILPRTMSIRQCGKKCLIGETEVLTPSGWVRIDTIREGQDQIAQWKDGQITFTLPTKLHKYEHADTLYTFEGNHIHQEVTAEHKIPVVNDRTKEGLLITAKELAEYRPSHWNVPTSGLYIKDESILTQEEIQLLVLIQADATIDPYNNVIIKVAKMRKLKRAKSILDSMSLRYTETNRGFFVHNSNPVIVRLAKILGRDKNFGAYLLSCSLDVLATFIREVPHWDGYRDKMQYFSTNKNNAIWVQTIAHLVGGRATIKERAPTGWGKKPIYWVKIGTRSHTALVSLSVSKQASKAPVYCPTVESGLFLIRSNGKISITGNSNHGLNYDEGYNTFALINEIQQKEAKDIINKYHAVYPGIRQTWHKGVQTQLGRDRTLWNPLGRKRQFLDMWGDSLFKAAYAHVPQSTVSDLLNDGIISIYHDKTPHMASLEVLGQVHDSILIQIPLTELKVLGAMINTCKKHLEPTMEVHGRKFGIETDMKIGYSWGHMEEVDIENKSNEEIRIGTINALDKLDNKQ